LPLSKSASNFLAFIDSYLLNTRAANRDDPDIFSPVCSQV
jgi:hypothetical protein